MNTASLELSRLEIVDDRGATRILLSTWEDGSPLIQLYDKSQTPRMQIGLDGEGNGTLAVSTSDGNAIIGLGVGESGEHGISIANKDGLPIITLLVNQNTGGIVAVRSASGDVIWKSNEGPIKN